MDEEDENRFFREPEPDQEPVVTAGGLGLIAAALAKAQGEFGEIKKNRIVVVETTRGSYEFAYATLDEILKAVRHVLSMNGIAVVQRVVDQSVETLLIHESDQCISCLTPYHIENRGQSSQAFGTAISYARRYGLMAALGLAGEDESDAETAEVVGALQDAAEDTARSATTKAIRSGKTDEYWGGPLNKTQFNAAIREFDTDLNACEALDMLIALTEQPSIVELLEQCKRDRPSWWETQVDPKTGLPSDVKGIGERISEKRKHLEELEVGSGI